MNKTGNGKFHYLLMTSSGLGGEDKRIIELEIRELERKKKRAGASWGARISMCLRGLAEKSQVISLLVCQISDLTSYLISCKKYFQKFCINFAITAGSVIILSKGAEKMENNIPAELPKTTTPMGEED